MQQLHKRVLSVVARLGAAENHLVQPVANPPNGVLPVRVAAQHDLDCKRNCFIFIPINLRMFTIFTMSPKKGP